jgi:hypothetical protein
MGEKNPGRKPAPDYLARKWDPIDNANSDYAFSGRLSDTFPAWGRWDGAI